MENSFSLSENVVSSGEAFEKLYHSPYADKSFLDGLFEDMGRSYAIEPEEVKRLCFEHGFYGAMLEMSGLFYKRVIPRFEVLKLRYTEIKENMENWASEKGTARILPMYVDEFLYWFIGIKHKNLLLPSKIGKWDTELPEIGRSDFKEFSEYVSTPEGMSEIDIILKQLPIPEATLLPPGAIPKPAHNEPTTKILALYYYCLSQSGTIERLVGRNELMALGGNLGVGPANFYKYFNAITNKSGDDPLMNERAISGAIKRLREENQEVALKWLKGQNWAKDHLSE